MAKLPICGKGLKVEFDKWKNEQKERQREKETILKAKLPRRIQKNLEAVFPKIKKMCNNILKATTPSLTRFQIKFHFANLNSRRKAEK